MILLDQQLKDHRTGRIFQVRNFLISSNISSIFDKNNNNFLELDLTSRWITQDGFLFYHETQSQRLCGQHTINNLLQQSAFNQRELNLIADHFFSNEVHLLHQPDESWYCTPLGDYSIQVIESALNAHNITLQRLPNTSAFHPISIAYIIQNNDHWFTIRKAGDQWFNLNSQQSTPTLISNFNLTTFVNTLAGNSIVFAVHGPIPDVRRTPPVNRNEDGTQPSTSGARQTRPSEREKGETPEQKRKKIAAEKALPHQGPWLADATASVS